MTFAIIAPPVATQKWKNIFEEIAPQIPLIIGTETNCPEDVVCVMVWNHPRGALKPFTNLKLIFSMGAGVDHIMNDDTIPLHIPICRVIDPQMAFSMSNYILMAVLNYHRSFYEFQNAQQNRHWAQFEFGERKLNIGVLGTGHLGMDVAKKMHYLGFSVFGYSASKKETAFPSYHGDGMDVFLSKINVLVCTVPYTKKTHALLNANLFQKLKNPTYLINVSRGKVQVEKDILDALNSGVLTGAFLDVFEHEPLPSESMLWLHPKVQITPHIASLTYPHESVLQVFHCFDLMEKGLPIPQQVDRQKMY